jgi:tetratricopeptide (TPR) repeat protein
MTRVLKMTALLALGAATIASLRWAVYLPLACEGKATRAIEELDAREVGSDASRRAAARAAESHLQSCECLQGTDFKIAYAHGIAYRYRGDTQEAIRAFRRALDIDRRPEIYIALGLAQLDAIDRPAAIESFVAAGTFAPTRLNDIPYSDIRREATQRIRAVYGEDWVP